MSELLQRVEDEIQNRRLISRGQKILVAVSGGVDSMVLLHTLHSLAPELRWQISVAHFNHQLRGKASDADERLVHMTAKKLRVKFFGGSADVKAFAKASKISIEMAARKLRHEFLAHVAKNEKVKTIALAHHADDQVELGFLRLLRGAGGEGLAGMKWVSPSPVDDGIKLIRPLLGCAKSELQAFAQAEEILFRDDATNFSSDVLRNRIRNELLPLLREKYQPGLTKTVLRAMDIAGAESEFINASAQAWLAVRKETFESLPVALQRKILQHQLIAGGVIPDFDLIEQLRSTVGKFISVNSNLSVARQVNGEIRQRDTLAPTSFDVQELAVRLQGRAGQIEFGGKYFRWCLVAQKSFSRPRPVAGVEVFDADKIGSEITLRHWRAGDRFQPIGMKTALKLQDLFVNAKIPANIRRELILAATPAGEIFWVEGLRIGEKFKLKPETQRQFRWDWAKNSG